MLAVGIINLFILLGTGGIIFWYTQETWKIRLLSARPVLIIKNKSSNGSLNIKNIGNGPALNIEIRITQIHTNGGRTNLRNLLCQETQRHFINLGTSEDIDTKGHEMLEKYILANGREFSYGHKNVFGVLAIYNDVYNKVYYTYSIFRVINNDYILKRTFFVTNKKVLPKINSLDWLS